MRFIIPIILIFTLASCTSKAKLLENCADKDFLKIWGVVAKSEWNNTTYKYDYLTDEEYLEEVYFMERISQGSLSLQEKLSGINRTGKYEVFYKECERNFTLHPETFKQKYK